MPVFRHPAARSGSGARPTSDAARTGRLPRSDHRARRWRWRFWKESRCSRRADGRSPRGLAARAGAGGAVVPVAGSARALLALPRLHWHDAWRRRRSHRTRRSDSQEQVGSRPEVRRRIPEQRISAPAAGRVRCGRRLPGDKGAGRSHPRERRGPAYVRRRRRASGCLRGTLPNPDVQREGRLSRRLEQGRRGRARGRRRDDAQPRADPGPAALPEEGAARSILRAR